MSKDFIVKKDSVELKLSIKMPTFADITEADIIYSQKIAELIKNSDNKKLLLRQELEAFLKKEGIWTDKDIKHIEKLQKEVELLKKKLDRGGLKLSEGRKIAIDMMNKRSEVFETLKKRQSFDFATVESVAEACRTEYLIFCGVVYSENGQKFWVDFESMQNDKQSDVYRQGYVNALDVIFGVNSNIEKSLPETKWLLNKGFLNDELRYIDPKTKNFVTEDGNPIVDKQLDEIVEELPWVDDYIIEVVNS